MGRAARHLRRLGAVVLVAAIAVACDGQNIFDLEVGTCFDNAASEDGTLLDVPIVDCDEPHDNEVFANWELTQPTWPGPGEAERLARQGCLESFEDWVGIPPAASELEVSVLYPTEASWEQADDRQVTCVVRRADRERLTGTTEGSET